MFQGVVAPIRLTEAETLAPIRILHRRGSRRGLKCLVGLHRWTDWTDPSGHWALVTHPDGSETQRDILISRRYCPACSSGQTMVML